MPVTYVSQLARGEKVFGSELNERMQDYNHTAGINILGDCLPHANNFMELSEEKDARGLPKPRIHFSHGENENRMTAHAEKLTKEIWTEAGAKKMWTFQRNAHIIGTCRMGTKTHPHKSPGGVDYAADYKATAHFPSALDIHP